MINITKKTTLRFASILEIFLEKGTILDTIWFLLTRFWEIPI